MDCLARNHIETTLSQMARGIYGNIGDQRAVSSAGAIQKTKT